MKCVQDKADLQTYRMADREAANRVGSGRFAYVSRSLWKKQGRWAA